MRACVRFRACVSGRVRLHLRVYLRLRLCVRVRAWEPTNPDEANPSRIVIPITMLVIRGAGLQPCLVAPRTHGLIANQRCLKWQWAMGWNKHAYP